jgi:succinate dehydrogenase / fumarate reductase cytochrome b subunit
MIGTEQQPGGTRAQFVLRRIHSLTGVFPIGVYLLAHIFLENSFILGGAERYDQLIAFIGGIPAPLLLAAEIFLVWGPMLFHAGYGFVRLRGAELDNPLRNDHLGAYLYSLQRLSGVVAFFFIGYHVWSTRVQYYLGNAEISYEFMHAELSQPLVFAFYLIGVLAAVFHFTNGLWTFCITWGITVGRRAQLTARRLSLLFGAFMYGTAFVILMALRA